MKIMLTAVAVGSIGVYALVTMGIAQLHIKPAVLGGVLFGGLLFGVGISLFGYCPGTSVAACGEGHRDAMVGVAGMLAGAFAYVWLYPQAQMIAKALPDWGEITLPEVTGISPWVWVAGLMIAAAVSAVFFQNLRRRWSQTVA